jgi:hypothetical protein
LNKSPAASATETSDDPPEEKNGKGMPVAGAAPEATITLIKVCRAR